MARICDQVSYPEGPAFAGGALNFVEYGAHRVVKLGAHGREVVWSRPGAGPAGLVITPDGRRLVTCYDSNSLVELAPGGNILRTFRVDSEGRPFKGPNDLVADGAGGVYFTASGTFDVRAPAEGAVYHLSQTGRIRRLATGLHYANGIALTPDRRGLLVTEHLAGTILRFDIGPGGMLLRRRIWRDLRALLPDPPGAPEDTGPDGLEVDSAGRVYVCQYGAGRVLQLSARGELERTIDLPVRFVTNCCLGEHERVLYVTAAASTAAPPYPGAVYAVSLRQE